MTIPRLNGLWDEVGDSFNQLAKVLPDIINPNRKYLQGVRELLAQDPTLMQRLADAEAQSPGYLEKIGLGGLKANAASAGPSSQLLAERKKRAALTKPLSPEEQEELDANALGIQTPAKRAQEKANLKATETSTKYQEVATQQTQLETEIMNLTKEGRVADAQMKVMELGNLQAARKVVDEAAAKGKSIFQSYMDGELDPQQLGAVQAVPQFYRAWEAEFGVWREKLAQEDRRLNRAISWAQINSNGPEEQLAKERAKVAGVIAAFSPNLAGVDDVNAYMGLPAQTKLQLETADPNQLTPELQAAHRGMQAAKNYQLKMGRKEEQLALQGNRGQLSIFAKTILTGKNKDEKKAAIDSYNGMMKMIYSQLVEAGIKKEIPQIYYEPSKWRGNVKDLVFSDASQEALDMAASLGLVLSPKQQAMDAGLANDPINAAVDMILQRAGSDSSKIEQEIMLAGEAGLDKTKLRTAIARRRSKNK